jgi:hypothetical protein
VGADDRAELADHDLLPGEVGAQEADEGVDVGCVPMEDGEVLRPLVGNHLVGQPLQRPGPGALLGARLHLAVDHLDARLDRQDRPEQGLGRSDTATLLEVLEGVEAPEHLCAPGHVLRQGDDVVEAGAGRRPPGRLHDDHAQAQGD